MIILISNVAKYKEHNTFPFSNLNIPGNKACSINNYNIDISVFISLC